MCVLMLRGPQTPGELKQRGERIHAFKGLDGVHATLTGLIERGLAARLERRPGQKEERYVQLLGEDSPSSSGEGSRVPAAASLEGVESPVAAIAHVPGLSERITRLEREVAELRAALIQRREGVEIEPAVESGDVEPAVQSGDVELAVQSDSSDARGSESDWSEGIPQPAP
jgi:hypothetical protein